MNLYPVCYIFYYVKRSSWLMEETLVFTIEGVDVGVDDKLLSAIKMLSSA